ncbi:hypothetical protein KIPB_001829 [Kipferlia bialata]|uniref:Clathrin/coatomer adaptor adaptin-like N-terminal domain-containing protein n=1 Tax=Kipferlia bialata TaxID=797122 RepID=A0A9K3CQX0_9EUKA|nr:hypothetical protein KIPB_001829 [Kipferlia bialata]|eukprot:g1829.t1
MVKLVGVWKFLRSYEDAGSKQDRDMVAHNEIMKCRKWLSDPNAPPHKVRTSILKLVALRLNGYDFGFGFNACCQLIASRTPKCKAIGYLATACLLPTTSSPVIMLTNTLMEDLTA